MNHIACPECDYVHPMDDDDWPREQCPNCKAWVWGSDACFGEPDDEPLTEDESEVL
jgi:hypothetical protein